MRPFPDFRHFFLISGWLSGNIVLIRSRGLLYNVFESEEGEEAGMGAAQKKREEMHLKLVDLIERMGYPREFGHAIAVSLRTEKAMARMMNYLIKARPGSAEEIADEMLAIQSDRERWAEKIMNEYYTRRYNEYLYSRGREEPEEDDCEE